MNMAGTDSHTKQHQVQNGKARQSLAATAVQSLLSLERAQKLDLLIHLVANLRQSLVVCGPDGIGKTTILNTLQEKQTDSWHYCNIQGSRQLSFEQLQADLLQSLYKATDGFSFQNVNEALEHLQQAKQIVVLMIDSAGQLMPGMISALCQFASAHANLRMVFALTPDELHIKGSSDPLVNECHFIDIPPLTEKQCGEFLQNLSGQPGAVIGFNAISQAMITKIYRDTDGIPGKIADIQSGIAPVKSAGRTKWLMPLLVSAVLALGISYWLWSGNSIKQSVDTAQAISTKTLQVAISPPVIQAVGKPRRSGTAIAETGVTKQLVPGQEYTLAKPVAEVPAKPALPKPVKHNRAAVHNTEMQTKAKKIKPQAAVAALKPQLPVVKQNAVQKNLETASAGALPDVLPPTPKQQKVVKQPAKPLVQHAAKAGKPGTSASAALKTKPRDDTQWVLAQPPRNYTLQLMALSKRNALLKVKAQFKSMAHDLHYYKSIKNGRQRYVLLLGSYASSKKAGAAMRKLPPDFKNAWKRRYRTLQKEIKANIKESSL